jgi:hypothetical protein
VATIVTRAGKGAALTHQEVDANFTGLNTELGQKEVASNKGVANGYASLDAAGKVPSAQLPSYVDDVVEVANFASLPGTGETGKIYVTIDANKTYRWTGSAYIEISASPGSTDSLAEGSTNLYFTQARARSSVSASGSLSYNSSTGVMSFTDAVTSVAGRTGAVTLTSSDVGLGNVENKSSATIRGEITSSNVTTALGFTPYNATNPNGYITSSALSSYLPLSGGTLVGKATFPSAADNRPQFPGGLLGVDTGDSNFDIWGISRDYYPSHPTASNAWGIRWDGDSNQVRFIGAATTRLAVDLDGGASGLTWEGNTVAHGGNFTSFALSSGQVTAALGYTPPQPNGTGASGSWGINVTGNAATVTNGVYTTSAVLIPKGAIAGDAGCDSTTGVGLYRVEMSGYSDLLVQLGGAGGSTPSIQIRANYDDQFWIRASRDSETQWDGIGSRAKLLLHTGNYNSYAPTLTGTGASGTWSINVTGTAGSISGYNNPATAPTANTIAYRDGNGDIAAREIVLSSSLSSATPTVLVSMYPSSNQLVRTTPAAVATAIQGAASGTWGINISGSAASATALNSGSNFIARTGSTGNLNTDFSNTPAGTMRYQGDDSNISNSPGNTWWIYEHKRHSNSSNAWGTQIAWGWEDNANRLAQRNVSGGNWSGWVYYLNSGNYSSYALPLSGGTLTGGRPIQLSTSDGAIFLTGSSGGWSMGTYYKGSSGTIRAGFGALGSNNDLSYAWIGAGYENAWLTLAPGAVNSTVALQQGGNQVLHAGNYTSYSPSLTGSGASGTWSISITGNAGTVGGYAVGTGTNSIPYLNGSRNLVINNPETYSGEVRLGAAWNRGGVYASGTLTMASGGTETHFVFGDYVRAYINSSSQMYLGSHMVLNAGNYNNYAPSLGGSGASGTWGINISGIASSSNSVNSSGYGVTNYTWRQESGTFAGYSGWASYMINNHGDGSNYYNQTLIMPFWSPPQYSRLEGGTFRGPYVFLSTENYSNYALPLSGGTLTGDIVFADNSARTLRNAANNAGYRPDDIYGNTYMFNASGGWYGDFTAYYWRSTGGSNLATLDGSGNFVATANVTAYSDERVKANWRKLDNGFLVNLANVKSGIYDRTDVDVTQAGVSAQSLREVLPEAVIEAENGDLSVAYGNAAMVSAVELAKELITLRNKVAELEARIH